MIFENSWKTGLLDSDDKNGLEWSGKKLSDMT
jgi:hypothetical protein